MNLSTLFLLNLFTRFVQSAATCYHLDGSVISTNYACQSGNSPCCAPGWACLKSGLCQWTTAAVGDLPVNGSLVRGSCTDQSWVSTSCPNICNTPGLDNFDNGEFLFQCPGSDSYYCNNNASSVAKNCTESALSYSWASDQFSTVALIGQPSASFSASAMIQATATIMTAITVPVTVPSTSTPLSGNASQTLSPSSSATPPSGSKSDMKALGIGLGVGLSVLASAFIAAMLLLRKRRGVPSPPPFRPSSYAYSEAVEPNGKFIQGPLMSPTSSTRISQPLPLYEGNMAAESDGQSSRHQGEQMTQIHELA